MIKEFVERWNKYKGNLEEYFKNTKQEKYETYYDITKLLFEKVINQEKTEYYIFDINNIRTIDDGDYDGTQIFIIPLNAYSPDETQYVVTHTYYGSCSGCDTLQAIQDYSLNKLPNEEQVKDYMQLALHLLQKCKWLYEEEE